VLRFSPGARDLSSLSIQTSCESHPSSCSKGYSAVKMAHVQKPDFVFRRDGRVHVTRRGRQFSRLLAAAECGSAGSVCTVLEGLCSAVVLGCWVPTPVSCCPLTSPPTRHRVPCHLNHALPAARFMGLRRPCRKSHHTLPLLPRLRLSEAIAAFLIRVYG
jgi:hypothetical protein